MGIMQKTLGPAASYSLHNSQECEVRLESMSLRLLNLHYMCYSVQVTATLSALLCIMNLHPHMNTSEILVSGYRDNTSHLFHPSLI